SRVQLKSPSWPAVECGHVVDRDLVGFSVTLQGAHHVRVVEGLYPGARLLPGVVAQVLPGSLVVLVESVLRPAKNPKIL
ncbi:unnamed protein product, partial [Ixodes hexagonus]